MINLKKYFIYIDYIVLFEYDKFKFNFSTKDDERIQDVQQKIMRNS